MVAGPNAIFDIPLNRINGEKATLQDYKGKVLLVVNTASKCGLTPQYTGLENLVQKYRGQGFEVLGFPSNEFMGQEPGSNDDIQSFCSTQFNVTFPLFEKTHVNGSNRHTLYQTLTSAQPKAVAPAQSDFGKKLHDYGQAPKQPSDILWNFEKFLIDRNGQIVGRFSPDMTPEDPILVRAIEKALG